jgi:hypothetical protein
MRVFGPNVPRHAASPASSAAAPPLVGLVQIAVVGEEALPRPLPDHHGRCPEPSLLQALFGTRSSLVT